MSPRPICVLCNQTVINCHTIEGDLYSIECKICGKYESTDLDNLVFRGFFEAKKAMISAYTRELYEYDSPKPKLHTLSVNQIENIIERYKKKTVIEKLNNLILYGGRKSHYFGQPFRFDGENDYPITYSANKKEFDNIQNQAVNAGYFILPKVGGNAELTWEGWKKLEQLKELGILSKKCFVAMSCSEDLSEIYKKGIREAIIEAGYEAIFIEKEEHNEKICDLIIAEIRACKFLIVDVTGQRQNVYYEAGFAQGLGRDVIWTCKQDEIKEAHFDTRQYNHITWEDAEDLRKKLVSRIKATIL